MVKTSVVECFKCEGSGVNISTDLTCWTCHGTGYLLVEYPVRICDYCNGSGFVHGHTCAYCKGCGYAHRKKSWDEIKK